MLGMHKEYGFVTLAEGQGHTECEFDMYTILNVYCIGIPLQMTVFKVGHLFLVRQQDVALDCYFSSQH